MMYLIDAFSTPPMVVLMSDDIDQVAEVGQRYANQVGRPVLAASGPAPVSAQFLPVLPEVAPATVPSNPADIAPVAPVLVSFDPAVLTADQRKFLESVGIKTS